MLYYYIICLQLYCIYFTALINYQLDSSFFIMLLSRGILVRINYFGRYEAAIAGYKHQLKENLTVSVEEKQNGETDKRPKTTLHSMRAFVADQVC